MKNLVTPAWLASHLGAAGLVIFDATKYLPNEPHDGLTKFREAHIAGARFFDLDLSADQDTTLPHMVPTPGRFAKLIGADKSRLDFDLPDPPAKEDLTERLNALIAAAHPTGTRWISGEELDAKPDLVRTLSVQPPRGVGQVRLVRIGPENAPIDLQPCGGTHVANTAEIGRAEISKIENKGKQNRRLHIILTGEKP